MLLKAASEVIRGLAFVDLLSSLLSDFMSDTFFPQTNMGFVLEGGPIPQEERKRSISTRRGVPLWLYGFLCLALLLLCLLQFHSWISVEQGASTDVKNPLATPFYVVDEGDLAVLNVSVVCEYLTQTGMHIARVSKVLEPLTFKQRQMLPSATSIADTPRSYGSTSFTVTVDYRVEWLPLHRSQTFRFKSAALAGGTYLWLREK